MSCTFMPSPLLGEGSDGGVASNKRAAFAWQELNDVRREYGLPPVPLTGFVPNVSEPRKQKRWDE